eukprot:m.215623 g.215623  ORF g.215623 m.215623 type:complete len:56 (-) comp54082_c1_seq1:88-255(-)
MSNVFVLVLSFAAISALFPLETKFDPTRLCECVSVLGRPAFHSADWARSWSRAFV